MQRVHLYEILKMRVQFMKDDDGKVWFNYAKDIVVRKIKYDLAKQLVIKEVQQINMQAKKELITELNRHLDKAKSAKAIHGIYNVMDKHYGEIKDQSKIEEVLRPDSYFHDKD